MSPSAISVEHAGLRATVTLRRPDVHNAFDEVTIAELQEAFDALALDASVRVVVIAGEGRSFCAGADLNWMARAAGLSMDENRRDAAALATMLESVAGCPHPVVARVHGLALGGGCGLVAAADIAVADEDTQFGFSEVRLGLVPATIAPFVVTRIGPGHARQLFLTGERFGAQRALATGLVHRAIPAAELDAAVDESVTALVAGGAEAQSSIKMLLRHLVGGDPVAIRAYTSGLIAQARASAEGREGVTAFLEHRRPDWLEEPR